MKKYLFLIFILFSCLNLEAKYICELVNDLKATPASLYDIKLYKLEQQLQNFDFVCSIESYMIPPTYVNSITCFYSETEYKMKYFVLLESNWKDKVAKAHNHLKCIVNSIETISYRCLEKYECFSADSAVYFYVKSSKGNYETARWEQGIFKYQDIFFE